MVKARILRPGTVEDLAEIIRSNTGICFQSGDIEAPNIGVRFDRLKGILEHRISDQVVVVRAGTKLCDLNVELAKSGQCIPIPEFAHIDKSDQGVPGPDLADWFCMWLKGCPADIGRSLSMNYPHALEAQCGSWRDWVLGMTVVRADGSIARCGSKVVKNVAGYDLNKLLIGSRYSLAIPVEVTLRTMPLRSVPLPDVELVDLKKMKGVQSIQRVLPSDFAALKNETREFAYAFDNASCTAWLLHSGRTLRRYPGDWVFCLTPDANVRFMDPAQIGLMRRAKDIFDPTHKLNPGAVGIF